MVKTKNLTVPLYGVGFTLILYDKPEELKEKYKQYDFRPDVDSFDGAVFRRNGKPHICFLKYQHGKTQYPTPGIITHEAKHFVNDVFQYVGQELDRYNDEAECYLLGWVVNRIHEFVK